MKTPGSMRALEWTQLPIISRTQPLRGLKPFAVCEFIGLGKPEEKVTEEVMGGEVGGFKLRDNFSSTTTILSETHMGNVVQIEKVPLSLKTFRGMQFALGMLPLCMRVGGKTRETAMEDLQSSFSNVLCRKELNLEGT